MSSYLDTSFNVFESLASPAGLGCRYVSMLRTRSVLAGNYRGRFVAALADRRVMSGRRNAH